MRGSVQRFQVCIPKHHRMLLLRSDFISPATYYNIQLYTPFDLHRFDAEVADPKTLPPATLKFCMAACHSLTMIQEKLSGDPVDLIMFNAVGFALEEPPVSEPLLFDLVAPTIITSPHGGEHVSISITLNVL